MSGTSFEATTMREAQTNETLISTCLPTTEQSTPCLESSDSEESVIAMSESQFFPTSSDAIWRSATIIRAPQPPEPFDLLEPEMEAKYLQETLQGVLLVERSTDEESSDEDDAPVQRGPDVTDKPITKQPPHSLPKEFDSSIGNSMESKPAPQPVSTSHDAPQKSAGCIPMCNDEIMRLINLPAHLPPLPSGTETSAEELEDKLECGLRFLDNLVHTNSHHGNDLKQIYDAYYNFAQALFEDIKVSPKLNGDSDAGSDISLHIGSEVGSDRSDMTPGTLEQQKSEICNQEALLEKEILRYKATKRELQRVADEIEEASKVYRKPEVLADVIIPTDVKFSSSSEYVAEIQELQTDILKKQEELRSLYREIQERYLPKGLVDSICESHRLADLALKDIEDETQYLKECVERLDLKYLYNLQIS